MALSEWVNMTGEGSKSRFRRLLFLPPLILGVAAVVVAVQTRQPPQRLAPQERTTAVRVIAVPRVTVVPRALGYGTVEPAQEWSAVAEVAGEVVEMHPLFRNGEFLPAGTVLMRIDPTHHELAVQGELAVLAGAQARLAEMAAREENLQRSRAIEARSLALARRDLERKLQLRARGTISQAAVDAQERAVLTSEQRVQELANQLNLIPPQRAVIAAQEELSRAQLAEARLDLARTEIAAPFDLRIAAVNVELAQFARQGEVLATADGIAVSEVAAQFPIERMRHLVPTGLDPSQLTAAELMQLPQQLGLEAVVRLHAGDFTATWPARFSRLSEAVDPRTRMVGVIVAVDEPLRKAVPGVRPPLTRGMYVAVELRGGAKPDTLVAPRAALHRGQDGGAIVYVAGADDRLERRQVEIGFSQADFVTVKAGLTVGERVVLSDPVPAIEGMLLLPTSDDDALARLLAQAIGAATIEMTGAAK